MATDIQDRRAVIAEQNDLVRTALADPEAYRRVKEQGLKFKLVWTPGINEALVQNGKAKEMALSIAGFDAFDEDNDPHQERDFAALEIEGTKVFFKFDGVDAPSHSGIAMCQTGFVRSQFN